jgi:galactokinase
LGLGIGAEGLAHLAHRAEVEFAGVSCGIMDQMACGLGQPKRMLFLDTMTLERRLLPLPEGAELLVMHSGVPRALADSAYNSRRAECDAAAALLGVDSLRMIEDVSAADGLRPPLRERVRHVITENRRVVMALNADAAAFGALMT